MRMIITPGVQVSIGDVASDLVARLAISAAFKHLAQAPKNGAFANVLAASLRGGGDADELGFEPPSGLAIGGDPHEWTVAPAYTAGHVQSAVPADSEFAGECLGQI
jgi:hypothetical protein